MDQMNCEQTQQIHGNMPLQHVTAVCVAVHWDIERPRNPQYAYEDPLKVEMLKMSLFYFVHFFYVFTLAFSCGEKQR